MTTSPPSTTGIDSPRAWLQVAACFTTTFTVYGINYSFGAFFKAMSDTFGSGRAATSLVFGITTATVFLLGAVSGRIGDRVGPRPLLLAGAALLGLSLWATSVVGSLTVGYLTLGGGMGLATALVYVPMTAAVGAWFTTKRALALAIAVSGIGVGNLVLNPLSAKLIDRIGWRETYRWYAVGGVIVLLACAVVARPAPRPAGPVDTQAVRNALRSPIFRWLYIAASLVTFALFVPFVHLTNYAKSRGISAGRAAFLVGLIGAFSVAGRVIFGLLGSRFGSKKLYLGAFTVLAASFLLWLAAGSSYAVLVVFTLVFGVSYGAFIALAPAVTSEEFGVSGLGAILGTLYTSSAIGGLFGPPVAGWLIDRNGYRTTIVIAMIVAGLGAAALIPVARSRSVQSSV